MKWLIASDIHGSAHYCKKLIEAYKRENAARLLLLGDILYHGPRNDLPEGYAPREVIALLNDLREDIVCVRGNCDSEVDQMVLKFPIMAEYAIICASDRLIFATHGHVFNNDNPPMLHRGDILMHGHTHVPKCEEHAKYVYVNPGSVALPKENSVRSYMTLEEGILRWKDLDGVEYMSFAFEAGGGLFINEHYAPKIRG